MIEAALKTLLFVVCLALSAFFSSSEVALIAITKAKVRTLVNEGHKGAASLATLKESPERILITILIGNNIVNIAAAAIATAIAIDLFGEIGVGIATGVVIVLLLIFGEIGPKMYASRHIEGFALTVAPIILYFSRVLSPLVLLVERFSRRDEADGTTLDPAVTEAEIKEWIDVGKEGGAIEQKEREMLYSVFEFGDTTAREVMTPRLDVTVMEDTNTLNAALQAFDDTGFSRIPIYHDRIDNIIGILNIKDVFAALVADKRDTPVKELMFEPYFIPETKKIDDLLKELQLRRVHLAVVLDEYSNFVGVITVEDILEELVGDILDEFDSEEPAIVKAGEGVYIIDGQIWVEDLNKDLGIDLPLAESYETVGGLIIDRLGHIPHQGERVSLSEQHITLVVLLMQGHRIVKIKVVLQEGSSSTPLKGEGLER
ncbi:MAG: hemolysin family protein [Methanomicrobiales archaeon]|nr:hemolysin family protein [Methanomicrobiales archaeon]